MKQYRIQLADHNTGENIIDAGGVCYVAQAGLPTKAALLDSTGASISNPVALTNGKLDFYVADTVLTVDLYLQAPSGHFVTVSGVKPSGPNEIRIDKNQRINTWKIPFDIADTTAAVETDTGFDIPANAMVLGVGVGVLVDTVDATETIDVGILSGEAGGDANGFMATLDVAAAVFAKATLASAGQTLGALLTADESGAGVLVPEGFVGDGTAESVSYTLTAGTDTAAGFIEFPVMIP